MTEATPTRVSRAKSGKPDKQSRSVMRDDTDASAPFDSDLELADTPSVVVESLRYLVARARLDDDGVISSRLAVVSANHGEGVTTISRLLASILSNDLKAPVCWVDLASSTADPSGKSEVGMFDVIGKRAELDAALVPTSNPLLARLLPGRAFAHERAAFIRSSRLADVFEELDRRFRHVIIDVPPVLQSSDALAILYQARSYLLVVNHSVTTIPQVRSVAEELRTIPSLGVVVNNFEPKMPRMIERLFVR